MNRIKQLQLSIILLLLSFLIHDKTFAQCSGLIQNLPDTIHACKNTSILLSPTVSTIGNAVLIDTVWTPGINFTDSNIINPALNVGAISGTYTLDITSVTASNIIANGDFQLGNSLFSSAYVPGTGGTYGLLSNEAQYAISTNPNLTHINFASFGDHTTGTGNMMVINGASLPNVNIWCQTIAVNPNTTYDFSAWGATCVSSAPAILQFSINGVLTGTPLALPNATGVWSQFHTTWFSGTNTSITICITDQTAAASGNDFAIDDIAFKEICHLKDSVYVDVVNLTPGISTDIHLGCKRDTVNFTADFGTGNVPDSYSWIFGDATSSSLPNPTHIYYLHSAYQVKLVVSKNGCMDSVTVIVDVTHGVDAAFNTFAAISPPTVPDNDSTCLGIGFDAFSLSTGTNISHEWNWGDGTINTYPPGINTDLHVYANQGNYVLTLKVTDFLGCVDSAKVNLFVDEPGYADFTVSDSIICLGQPVFLVDTISSNAISFNYNFGDGKILNDIHNPSYVYDIPNSGGFPLVLTTHFAKCPDILITKNIFVDDYPLVGLGKDTSICPGVTNPILLSNTLAPGTILKWNNGQSSSSIAVSDAGKYWASATSNNGKCTTTDSIVVLRDCFINIPNSFSPNEDGINDYFLPREILSSGLKTFNMQIFNRWGEMIYQTSNLNGRGWDGKFGDKKQAMGVFVYTIEATFNNNIKKSYKGNVTLVR